MAQGVLPFNYEVEKEIQGVTASSGLPVYLDLVHVKAIIPFKHSHLEAAAGVPEGVNIDVYKSWESSMKICQ
jgi:hypothetical protein